MASKHEMNKGITNEQGKLDMKKSPKYQPYTKNCKQEKKGGNGRQDLP